MDTKESTKESTEELSLLKKLVVLWHGRKLILFIALISFIASWIYASHLPLIYRASCYFLPPNQDMNRISSLTGSLMGNTTAITPERIGGVADLAGLPQTVTSGQMILGIMRRNTVVDVIIERFNLMEVYKQTYKSRMRDLLLYNILETEEDTKSGIITVSITDEDPQRAADIANAFVETLQAKMLDLSLNEAVQRRIFFEEQVEKSREALNKAEAEMLEYQREGGSSMPETQMQERLRSITHVQQQIIYKNSEISALLTFARPDNPRVRAAQSQLETLTKELERLESEQRAATPNLSVEYQRHAMNLHLATAAYEVVLKQYENAKIDEAQGFFPLQVIDYATPPDFKFKPSKARIILVGTFLGMMLGVLIVVVREFRKNMKLRLGSYLNTPEEIPVSLEKKSQKSNKIKIISFIFVLSAIALILFLTFQSEPNTESISMKFQMMLMSFYDSDNIPSWVSNMIFLRAFAHIPLYMFLSVSAFISFYLYGMKFRRSLMIAFILSALTGLTDECIKIYLPGREFDFTDWILDITGIILGLGMTALLSLCTFKRKRTNEHEDED